MCLCPYVEFSLNDCTPGSWTLTPVCICGHRQDTVTCLCRMEATVSFHHAHPGCCHTAASCKQKTHSKNMHIINTKLLSLVHVFFKCRLCFSYVTGEVLVGEDSFTKCTLYVFQNHWEDPGSHITSFLPHLCCCVWSIIIQCYKSFKKEMQPFTWAEIYINICSIQLLGVLVRPSHVCKYLVEGLVCPVTWRCSFLPQQAIPKPDRNGLQCHCKLYCPIH